ncbi:MAG: hypothetical protein DCF30_04595 [Hyphomicrobiales bacterium]|nr:MAG: hypothetical protein DCF30_04595 [Hyphomicrobiales bacterium]
MQRQNFTGLLELGTDAATVAPFKDEFETHGQGGKANAYARKDGGEFGAATVISPVLDDASGTAGGHPDRSP